VNVLFADEQDEPIVTDELLMLAELVLDAEGLDDDTGVAIVLIDEPQMAELNETHMGKEGPTDVLSFPIETARPGLPPTRVSGGPPIELGDVFIAPSIVRRNAEQQGVPFEDELALMIVHGLLHLLGWDHEDEADAIRMERRERELLARIGRVRP
jgi:probable rRNA maturation factor